MIRLARDLAARLERRSARRAGVVLVYHRVAERLGDPRYELTPALAGELFEAQLQYLRKAYRVVSPSQLLAAAVERRRGEPFPVAITFDDDLRSHVDVVAPALLRAALPAAFFVSGGSRDGMHSFWWQDLQMVADRRDGRLLRLRSLPNFDLTPVVRGLPYAIHKAAEAIENLPRADRDAVAAELRTLAERPAEGLAAADIRWLASAGFEIGFHTRRHYLLTTLAPPELATAMTDGRHELEALIGQQLKMIAYPHGKANAIVADRARSAGYELGFTAFPTCAGPTTDPLLIGRAEVPIGSLRDFVQMISKTFRDHGT